MNKPRVAWILYRTDNGCRLGRFDSRKSALLTAAVLNVPAYVSRCDNGHVKLGAIRDKDGSVKVYHGGG